MSTANFFRAKEMKCKIPTNYHYGNCHSAYMYSFYPPSFLPLHYLTTAHVHVNMSPTPSHMTRDCILHYVTTCILLCDVTESVTPECTSHAADGGLRPTSYHHHPTCHPAETKTSANARSQRGSSNTDKLTRIVIRLPQNE